MTKLDDVARAMEARRRELIDKPLASIYPELAKAAIKELMKPDDGMEGAMTIAAFDIPEWAGSDISNVHLDQIYQAMLQHVLDEAET